MSVRRLAAEQPDNFAFTPQNLTWARKVIAQYPEGKQASAVIALLWRAQEQSGGWLPRPAMEYVGDMLSMAFIRVYEVATFYTMFQLQPVGRKAHVQVCGTTPCMLRGAEDLKAVCRRKINTEPSHISEDGDFSWEEVECLGACVNAPMVQIWKDTYEDLTPDDLEKLLDDLAAGREVKPGPQSGRRAAEPLGGPTSLTDSKLYDGQRHFGRTEPAAQPMAPPPAAPAAPAVTVSAPPEAAVPAKAAAPVTPPQAAAEPLKSPAPVVSPAAPAPTQRLVEDRATAAVKKPVPAKPDKTLPAGAEIKPKPAASKPAVSSTSSAGKPELLSKPKGKADDLKLIWGVGPALEKVLNKMGVWHFSQIAAWSAADLKWVDERLEGFKGRAMRDEWIKQCKKLATGWRPDNAVGDRPKGRGR